MDDLKNLWAGAIAGMALVGLLGAVAPANGAECPRGDLDVGFCDTNGELVADTPSDPS